jgi:hypothetical protein
MRNYEELKELKSYKVQKMVEELKEINQNAKSESLKYNEV